MPDSVQSTHPGPYIKERVIPKTLSVKKAAELLGIGRPALSNLLNANAALTADMALRIQKSFGADAQKLLAMQTAFDEEESRARGKEMAVRTYVSAFLKFEARQISAWATDNIEARAQLPALLRRLVQSTGTALSKVEFPAYDNAQRHGWDGVVTSDTATPWIPHGNSGWEFGCNQNPAAKAESDFGSRTATVPADERSTTTFVFVTPHNWPGKEDWAKEKRQSSGWKDVRALDASNLEEWLEQSIPTQAWFGNLIGNGAEGMAALDTYWTEWAKVTNPPLSKILFKVPVATHKRLLENWLNNPPSAPLIVTADSEGEAIAYLSCALREIGAPPGIFVDNAIILKTEAALRRAAALSADFIAIVSTPDVETVGASFQTAHHVLIVRRRNDISTEGDITLDLVDGLTFHEALADMKFPEPEFERYSRETANSPTILRRRLSNVPAIRTPAWASDKALARKLIPLNLVGVWDVDKPGDGEIVRYLTGREFDEIEHSVAEFRTVADAPIWSIGRYRGVTSKIDILFATHHLVTTKDLDDFLLIAQYVLSESDPALDLPQEQQWAANIYGKVRDHSSALRAGVCETLVLLAAHGNSLFQARLGIDIQSRVDEAVKSLLLPLNERTWASQKHDLPRYAEAAPDVFLQIVKQDLASAEPKILTLMQPAGSSPFGGCPRTGLLWALETLAWKPERLIPVSLILARLAEIPINDNWGNKPGASLQAIYRSWMPQTAANIDERNQAMEAICNQYPNVGWRLIIDELGSHHAVGHYSARPHWRNDASGAGQTVKLTREILPVMEKARELVLAWPKHDQHTLGDLVSRLEFLPEEDHEKVWALIKDWLATQPDDDARQALRETIRKNAFTRRAKVRGVKQPVKDRARQAYELLQPQDIVLRHLWLFAQHWVDESADELDDDALDYDKRTARVESQRKLALDEIWQSLGYEGLLRLCELSRAESAIGRCLFDVVPMSERLSILEHLVSQSVPPAAIKIDNVVAGFLDRFGDERDLLIKTLLHSYVVSGAGENAIRLLKCAPFRASTWAHLSMLPGEWEQKYWRETYVRWERQSEAEFSMLVTKLIEAERPLAAFETVHMDLNQVETKLLVAMLSAAVTTSEPHAHSSMDGYYISEAFKVLRSRSGIGKNEPNVSEVSKGELAQLEFMYVSALEHSEYGIPTLQEVLTEDPKLFMQLVALVYSRKDGGEDPAEWKIADEKRRQNIATSVYGLLHRMVRFPGSTKDGAIDGEKLRSWIAEARELGRQYGREEVVDSVIGEILGRSPPDADGVWPCEGVRKTLDKFGSQRMANGVSIGRFNTRGAQYRGPNGDEERAMAAQYRAWAKTVSYQYPFTAGMLMDMAKGYDNQAVWHDNDANVRKRLNH